MDQPRRPPISFRIFLVLSALDIAINAAAGAAAAATGAHVNHSPLTAFVLQMGALAGVTKAGILFFVTFLQYAGIHWAAVMLVILMGTSFGICVIIATEISNLVLKEIPEALLIAAVVAAIPLMGEAVGLYLAAGSLSPGGSFDTPASLALIGLDALGGYVFARMAHNKGMDICVYSAAAAAGAVYGTITGVPKFLLACIGGSYSWTNDNGHVTVQNVFGTVSYYERPKPFSGGLDW